MKKILFFVVMIVGIGFSVNAQGVDVLGDVKIIQDSRVDSLVQKHIKINGMQEGIQGFRIQIFFDAGNNSKDNANEVIEVFLNQYPDVSVYLSFKQPYYRVRVGDFRTRMEGEKFLLRIKRKYPNAWVINDEINYPALEK
ncbi:MAG: SPOR domain-containing protein [Bacteroidota bacterium]|nr:SPOR domain-containing protein [Bacteroidota bacterium]